MSENALRELDQAMARLGDGDRSAFDEVFRVLWPRILAFCTKALAGRASTAEAEDVAQRALVKVFERASQYDTERPAIAWALAIAGWECRSALQTLRRRKEAPDDALIYRADEGRSPEASILQQDLVVSLETAMSDLSPADRSALAAAFEHELAPANKGATFRKRKQRALERLRQAWRRIHEDE